MVKSHMSHQNSRVHVYSVFLNCQYIFTSNHISSQLLKSSYRFLQLSEPISESYVLATTTNLLIEFLRGFLIKLWFFIYRQKMFSSYLCNNKWIFFMIQTTLTILKVSSHKYLNILSLWVMFHKLLFIKI